MNSVRWAIAWTCLLALELCKEAWVLVETCLRVGRSRTVEHPAMDGYSLASGEASFACIELFPRDAFSIQPQQIT